MNDIVKAFGGNLPAANFDATQLQQAASRVPTAIDHPYLVFKDGEWSYGIEQVEVTEDELWAINPASFMFGLMEWDDSVPGGEILVPPGVAYSEADVPQKFPNSEDQRIVAQIAANLYCVSGENEGQEVYYKTSTRGGVSALNSFAVQIAKQAKDDPAKIVPVVHLKSDSYMHKKYKRKTYVPVIELSHWDDAELSASLADGKGNKKAEEKTEKEAPARGRGRGRRRGRAA